MSNLTTREAARLLHVSEATVKRWADDGLLRPEKTVGGHRRFSIQAIARLRRERGLDAHNQQQRKKVGATPTLSPATLLELLLHGAESEAGAALIDSYLHGDSLATLFDYTITETMHQVGDLWFKGTITVADEHLATRVVLSALEKLRGIVVPAEPTGLKAICCGIEGDLHEVPIHLAEMLLEKEGWEVLNLGPNTPLFALRDMVAQQRPQLVCIAAKRITDLDRLVIEYGQLRKVTEKIDALAVLGGEGVRDVTLRERLPADFYGEDFAGFSTFLRKFKPKGRT
ncbi:MAG TPA: helix-turn-helix domain-containing protein [Pyrinomonadaceae bacterium]|nr:helix-turn-helix domain-containing protein [Pyrinomonadaceae bacterium]